MEFLSPGKTWEDWGVAGSVLTRGTVLCKTFYSLLSTGSSQEDRKTSSNDWKIVDLDGTHQHKQVLYFTGSLLTTPASTGATTTTSSALSGFGFGAKPPTATTQATTSAAPTTTATGLGFGFGKPATTTATAAGWVTSQWAFGPRTKKTCGWGFLPDHTQTSLLSYKD